MSAEQYPSEGMKRFAEERSHKDTASTLEYTKLLIQLVVGGSGLAITALLTLAGAIKDQTEFWKYVGIPCIAYIFGVVCGALAAFQYARSQRKFAYAWQQASQGNREGQDEHAQVAIKFQEKADRWIKGGLLLFIIGSILALVIISIFSHKVTVPTQNCDASYAELGDTNSLTHH